MDTFDPVAYSIKENLFLLDHLGEPPVVALSDVKAEPLRFPSVGKDGRIKDHNPVYYPEVNPNAVKPILERVYELQELETHRGEKWIGVEKLKDAIRIYLDQAQKWSADRRRGRPRFPSMHSYDSKGRPHRQGPGSDSGQVRTYFGKGGDRIPFAVPLSGIADLPWESEVVPQGKTGGLLVDADKRRIECLVCGHTESFKPESRSSFNAARARMSKHLRSATDEVDLHRETHTNEFGS